MAQTPTDGAHQAAGTTAPPACEPTVSPMRPSRASLTA